MAPGFGIDSLHQIGKISPDDTEMTALQTWQKTEAIFKPVNVGPTCRQMCELLCSHEQSQIIPHLEIARRSTSGERGEFS